MESPCANETLANDSGLEADQKVIATHGCYAMTATTALTAQNTQGVQDIHAVPPAFVRKQIDACFDDIGVDVVKIGGHWASESVASLFDRVQACLRQRRPPSLLQML